MRAPILLLLALSVPTLTVAQEDQRSVDEFCFVAPRDAICAMFPEDVPEFIAFFEYMVISAAAQAPFDRHAWQAFVSLNWADAFPENPAPGWRDYRRRDAILGHDPVAECGDALAQAEVVITDLAQADGNILIDQNGNFIVYETRMNAVAEAYIWDGALTTLAGHAAAGPIDFTRGRGVEDPASVMLKTAWQILDAPDPNYINARGLIYVPATESITVQAQCLSVDLGMIGMHIVTKVESGNGDEWIWATFEHRNNAPVAATARDINAIYGADLFPDGCVAPDGAQDTILFGASIAETPNDAPAETPYWATNPPYAVDVSGTPFAPTQVVRCWEVFAPTQATNERWQGELLGTPLENYMLISAQWRGANASPYIEHGELPRFLSNTTMETFLQTDRSGTCLGCHADAVTVTGAPADFTFVLQEVHE